MGQFGGAGGQMDLLIALWLVVSLPAALLGGRWVRTSDRSGVDEIEAYLRRLTGTPRLGLAAVVRTGLVTSILLGSLLAVSTVIARRLPPVDVVTRPGAFAFGPFRPASSSTTTAVPALPRPQAGAVRDHARRPVHQPRPTVDDGPTPVSTSTSPDETSEPSDQPSEEAPETTSVAEPSPDRQPSDADGLAWMADPTASAAEDGRAEDEGSSDDDPQHEDGSDSPPADSHHRPKPAKHSPTSAPTTTTTPPPPPQSSQPTTTTTTTEPRPATTTTTTTTTTEAPAPSG